MEPATCLSAIESLPLEIFEKIISYLDLPGEARLYAASRSLQIYGSPQLFKPLERNQRAMRWALCHDDVKVLERCVSFGASLHIVTVFKTKPPAPGVNRHGVPHLVRPRSPKHLSTLILAARCGSMQVVAYLRTQGVVFEALSPGAVKSHLTVLMKRLVRRGQLHVLQKLIDCGFIAKVEDRTSKDIAWPVSRAILAGASLELMQRFIDAGADLHRPYARTHGGSVTPLTAAIFASTNAMTRLLVAHGARYEPAPAFVSDEGADFPLPAPLVVQPARPTCHPLFAAIQRLARCGGSEATAEEAAVQDRVFVDDCVAHGCDINRTEHRLWIRGFNWDWRPHQQLTTPLLEFLEALPSIQGSPAQQAATRANLAFLLDRGARTPDVPDIPGDLIQTRTPSCLELLLDRYQLAALNEPHFFALVTLLVDAGCMDGAAGRLMRRYCRGVCNQDPYFEPAWRGWRRLIDLLLTRPSIDPSVLLLHLLVDSGTKEAAAVERLLVSTVDYLISRGGDINAPVSPRGSSALHMLCSVYQHPTPDTLWWHRSPYQEPVVQHRRDVLHLMMSRGADPQLRFQCGRNAPMELIVYIRAADPSTRAWIKKVGRTLGEGMAVQRLMKLNGKSYEENRNRSVMA